MTYGELSNVKATSMEVNLIVDDIVNNARFSFGKKAFRQEDVSNYDFNKITAACERYKVAIPDKIDNAIIARCERLAEQNYLRGV